MRDLWRSRHAQLLLLIMHSHQNKLDPNSNRWMWHMKALHSEHISWPMSWARASRFKGWTAPVHPAVSCPPPPTRSLWFYHCNVTEICGSAGFFYIGPTICRHRDAFVNECMLWSGPRSWCANDPLICRGKARSKKKCPHLHAHQKWNYNMID